MDVEEKLIDLTYLEQSFGTEMIPEMLKLYESQVPEFTEGIKEHFDNKNWIELSRVAHKAKGSWVIVGIQKYFDMFRNFQLICEAFHLHELENKKKESQLSDQEIKVYQEIEKRGVGEGSDLKPETSRILLQELEKFKNGEPIQVVPEYVEIALTILNKSIPEVDEILAKF